MAERRMFAKTIIDSDAFLDMPQSTQLLYFQLSMRADDDGFINQPKSIMRICGAKDDDLKMLFAKAFIIPFDTGVVVIKHWRINNYIQKDRYKETQYIEEKAQLYVKKDGAYTLDKNQGEKMLDTECIQVVSEMDTQVRLGKDIDILKEKTPCGGPKEKTEKAALFRPPTLEEIKKYCLERKNKVDAERFYNFYTSKGWMVGKNKMKDWKAALRTWEAEDKNGKPIKKIESNFDERQYSDDEINSVITTIEALKNIDL